MTQGMVVVDPGRFDQQPEPRGMRTVSRAGGSALGWQEGWGVAAPNCYNLYVPSMYWPVCTAPYCALPVHGLLLVYCPWCCTACDVGRPLLWLINAAWSGLVWFQQQRMRLVWGVSAWRAPVCLLERVCQFTCLFAGWQYMVTGPCPAPGCDPFQAIQCSTAQHSTACIAGQA